MCSSSFPTIVIAVYSLSQQPLFMRFSNRKHSKHDIVKIQSYAVLFTLPDRYSRATILKLHISFKQILLKSMGLLDRHAEDRGINWPSTQGYDHSSVSMLHWILWELFLRKVLRTGMLQSCFINLGTFKTTVNLNIAAIWYSVVLNKC